MEIICEGETEPPFFQIPQVQSSTEKKVFGIYYSPLVDFPRFTEEREQLMKCIDQFKESFEDLQERQIFFVSLRSRLLDLRNKLTLERQNFLRLINMCIDVLDNTRSEILTIKQLETLEFLLSELDENVDDYTVDYAQEVLLNVGLRPIPNLEGIAELYR